MTNEATTVIAGPKLFDLSGRVALVTGGSGGIGLGIAVGLARAGAKIVIAGRDESKAAAALAEFDRIGTPAHFLSTDVSIESQCFQLVAEASAHFGRLDVLVNNAGLTIRKRPEDLSLDEWNQVLATNLTSAFLCAKAAYPLLREQGAGKIINVGSMYSMFGSSFAAAYGASKGGVVQLTRSLAVAWAADNIQANAILPGWIATDMGRTAQREVSGLNEKVVARTPAGRWGRASDIEAVAIFLASSGSDFVTGAVIPVDGGYSISG